MSWGALLEAIKLGTTKLIAIAITCFVIILLPQEWAQRLGYDEIIKPYRGWISLFGIAAFCFGLIQLVPNVRSWWKRRKQRVEILSSLYSLSKEEAFLLGYCLSRQRKTVLLGMLTAEYNVASGLCQKGLLLRASGQQNIHAVPHKIPGFVWHELNIMPRELLPPENDMSVRKYFERLDNTTGGSAAGLGRITRRYE